MAVTTVRSAQITDEGVARADLNITTTGQAVIRRVIAGTNITIGSTGVDTGTGDVTINVPKVPVRVGTTASFATPTPDADSQDQYTVTALAVNATFGAPTGTPSDGQNLIIRVKDNATARTLAFNAIYRAIGITLPTTTVISKTLYLGMKYNSADTKWDVLAYGIEA